MIKTKKRILLKLSGETLMGDQTFGIDPVHTAKLAETLESIQNEGFELAIVIGGGNIFRGISLNAKGLPRSPADQMGMLATLINGISLQQALLALNCPVQLMTALECPDVAESYNWAKANSYLANGNIVIFVGGTGNPYFTTDTAAALRASEIHADILMKATKVNGVYNKDPKKEADAKKYETITYSQYLAEKLEVMDAASIALCMNNHIPIFVFNMNNLGKDSMKKILSTPESGTLIK
jgi:uridylate kinase